MFKQWNQNWLSVNDKLNCCLFKYLFFINIVIFGKILSKNRLLDIKFFPWLNNESPSSGSISVVCKGYSNGMRVDSGSYIELSVG